MGQPTWVSEQGRGRAPGLSAAPSPAWAGLWDSEIESASCACSPLSPQPQNRPHPFMWALIPHSPLASQLPVYLVQSRLHRAPAMTLPLPCSQCSHGSPAPRQKSQALQSDNQNPVRCDPHPSLSLHISLLPSKQTPLQSPKEPRHGASGPLHRLFFLPGTAFSSRQPGMFLLTTQDFKHHSFVISLPDALLSVPTALAPSSPRPFVPISCSQPSRARAPAPASSGKVPAPQTDYFRMYSSPLSFKTGINQLFHGKAMLETQR